MKEGDQVLGGDQVTPANAPSITPDPASATSGSDDSSSVLQIHHDSPSHTSSSPVPQATAVVDDTATSSDAPDNAIVLDNIPPATEDIHTSDDSDSGKPAGNIIDAAALDNVGESSNTADVTPSNRNLNVANNIDGINRTTTAALSSPTPNISRPTGANTTIPVNTIPTGISAPDFARPAPQAPTTPANPTPTMASPNPTMMAAPSLMWTTGANPMATTGPYTGNDIVLGGTTPEKKKSKKWIIFVLIGLIAVTLVGVAIVGLSIKSVEQKQDVNTDFTSLFNIYSNYLLYGTESSEPVDDTPEIWKTNYIEQELSNKDLASKEAYFDNLILLFNNFSDGFRKYAKTQESTELDLEYIENIINNDNEALKTLRMYAITPDISMNDMVDAYLSQGKDIVTWTAETYASFIESESLSENNYGKGKVELAKNTKALYDEYSDMGCINEGLLVEECVSFNSAAETIIVYQNELSKSLSMINNAEWHITNDVIILSSMAQRTLNSIFDFKEVKNES